MSIYDIPATALDGAPVDWGAFAGSPLLIVNVASQCALTAQYASLQQLHSQQSRNGFSVIGVPCNQFKGQEPGTAGEIAEFCSANYAVTFPMLAKAEVNGPQRHPLYDVLTTVADADGVAGDVMWNFEKFLVSGRGEAVARFRPMVDPLDPTLLAAIDAELGAVADA